MVLIFVFKKFHFQTDGRGFNLLYTLYHVIPCLFTIDELDLVHIYKFHLFLNLRKLVNFYGSRQNLEIFRWAFSLQSNNKPYFKIRRLDLTSSILFQKIYRRRFDVFECIFRMKWALNKYCFTRWCSALRTMRKILFYESVVWAGFEINRIK